MGTWTGYKDAWGVAGGATLGTGDMVAGRGPEAVSFAHFKGLWRNAETGSAQRFLAAYWTPDLKIWEVALRDLKCVGEKEVA